jgi:2-polyprenyl-6-hydroxyphenyl methylase/3-demethylubiquinone-9 3-methyltransferase
MKPNKKLGIHMLGFEKQSAQPTASKMIDMNHNVNPQEIEQFDAASQDWWAPEGAFKSLHQINPLRLSFITQQVDLQNQRVIDVGCGGGILTESMALCGAKATGIDMSGLAIEVAQQHADEKKISVAYQKTTVEEMAEKHAAEFDVVTCMELLEHVPDPVSVIQACATLVKPQGHLFFSTLNRNAKSYLFAILAAEYVLKLLPRGLHHYDQFIKPSELAAWARSAGLDVSQMSGIGYNPLTKVYRLTQNTAVNYLMYCKKVHTPST